MSLIALMLVIVHVVVFGVSQNPQKDEGAAARIFQLLLMGQLPIVSYFAIRWAGKYPSQTIRVIIFQIVLILLAVMFIFILES